MLCRKEIFPVDQIVPLKIIRRMAKCPSDALEEEGARVNSNEGMDLSFNAPLEEHAKTSSCGARDA